MKKIVVFIFLLLPVLFSGSFCQAETAKPSYGLMYEIVVYARKDATSEFKQVVSESGGDPIQIPSQYDGESLNVDDDADSILNIAIKYPAEITNADWFHQSIEISESAQNPEARVQISGLELDVRNHGKLVLFVNPRKWHAEAVRLEITPSWSLVRSPATR